MTEPAADIEWPDPAAVAAVCADVAACFAPRDLETEEQREERLERWREMDAANRERQAQARAQHEAEQRAEQQRQQRAARAAASRALMEQAAQRQAERGARLDRERLALVESQLRAEQASRDQAARKKAVAEHWQFMDERLAEIDRIVNPPPPDPNGERIEALERQLATQAEEAAAVAERRRSQQYAATQAANIARRESRGW